jgi:hypothetical protein
MRKSNGHKRTESYFAQRAARADLPKVRGILKRAGAVRRPMKGDAMPKAKRKKKK